MANQISDLKWFSRRDLLAGSAGLLAGSLMGRTAAATAEAAAQQAGPPPPLPWKWVTLDPLEAGRRAYRFYLEKGGCGSATYLAFVTLLREKVGYPYTTLPDMMMIHAAAGYGGHGTLCGTLGGTVAHHQPRRLRSERHHLPSAD